MAERTYRDHLTGSADLETTYEAVRAGFVALALERNRRATPYVEQARSLRAAASLATAPADLLTTEIIQPALLAAAGVSDKAAAYLQPDDKQEAIRGLVANFLEPAGADFADELVFRFLLTRGDTLGGSMRNVGGALAQRRLTRLMLSVLSLAQIPVRGLQGSGNSWETVTPDTADIEIYLRGLCWQGAQGPRTLLYNTTVPLVKNNIDLCLLAGSPETLPLKRGKSSELTVPVPAALYVALGELKGGIDPAGADEHWKTAKSALVRVRQAFGREGQTPQTFFIGGAIARRMAEEIWSELQDGTLGNAANLTNPNQANALCLWLASL